MKLRFSKVDKKLALLAAMPWAIGALFSMIVPDLILPAIRTGWFAGAVVALTIWELGGMLATRNLLKEDDPLLKVKLVIPAFLFAFPLMAILTAGPLMVSVGYSI